MHRNLYLNIYLLCCLLLFSFAVQGQPGSRGKKVIDAPADLSDSLFKIFRPLFSKEEIDRLRIDSVAKNQLLSLLQFQNPSAPAFQFDSLIQIPSVRKKKFLQSNGGFVNYNWTYRSGVDTPYFEKDLSQHFITAGYNFTVAEALPIRLVYYGRQSNSGFFRDFNDFRVEFNSTEFQRIKHRKLTSVIQQYVDRLQDPLLLPSIKEGSNRINGLNDLLQYGSIANQFLRSKRTVMAAKTSTYISEDSLQQAKQFIAFYEKIEQQKSAYEQKYDSLLQKLASIQKQVYEAKSLLSAKQVDARKAKSVQNGLDSLGISNYRINKLLQGFSSIKTLALGRSVPSYSDLTLRNVSVKGVNFEYNQSRLYLALTGGTIDYHIRDFGYKRQSRIPQYVYMARLGYGVKEGNHIIASFFRGKKLLIGSTTTQQAKEIYGLSLSGQVHLGKTAQVNVEVAQSAAPKVYVPDIEQNKARLNINERGSTAYALRMKGKVPIVGMKVEGSYQHAGIDFQNFTAYKVNTTSDRWYAKAEQQFFKKHLIVAASIQKNTFENPYITQRYSANTVFKSFSAAFRSKRLPSLTISYMPSSQLTVIDSTLSQNFFQVLNSVLQHQYNIGEAKASTSFIYSKFFNNSSDTGFIYYNSSNYYLTEVINFSAYSANITLSRAHNQQYTMNVLEAGVNAPILKQERLGLGVKVNHLNSIDVKVGFYGNLNLEMPKVGSFSLHLEKSYLPGVNQPLVKNNFYNIGFTRYIK